MLITGYALSWIKPYRYKTDYPSKQHFCRCEYFVRPYRQAPIVNRHISHNPKIYRVAALRFTRALAAAAPDIGQLSASIKLGFYGIF